MPEARLGAGRKLLVVEDDYLIVEALTAALEDRGAEVAGAAGSIDNAIELVHTMPRIDGALLDVNLRGEMVFPVADALRRRGVPFVFTTGYDRSAIPERFRQVDCCEKPVEVGKLLDVLFG